LYTRLDIFFFFKVSLNVFEILVRFLRTTNIKKEIHLVRKEMETMEARINATIQERNATKEARINTSMQEMERRMIKSFGDIARNGTRRKVQFLNNWTANGRFNRWFWVFSGTYIVNKINI
jgi:histidyl-tRNA synthetase